MFHTESDLSKRRLVFSIKLCILSKYKEATCLKTNFIEINEDLLVK